MKYLLSVWLLVLSFAAFGQSSNPQQEYLNAKAFYKEGKYALAMEAFKPLLSGTDSNPFSVYASFYYALSAYNNNYPALARDMLLQIKQKNPRWSRMDEVNFWLAKIYFENESYNQALNALNSIRSKDLDEDKRKIKHYYFTQIEDMRRLENLLENNRDEKELASILAARIAAQPLVNQDQELLNQLINKYDLDPDKYEISAVRETVFKDEYDVALLLPFMASTLEVNERRKFNQFVLDLYQGIRLAVDSLESEGVRVNLYAYDTRRDSSETRRILEKEELKGMDLLIGPLYAPAAMVNEFSYKNKINVINPLSSNADVIGQNPFSFLINSSNETVGRKTAEFVTRYVGDKPGIIFYGDSPGDSAMAYAYKQRMEQDSLDIIITQKIRRGQSRMVLDLLLIQDKRLRDASSDESKEEYTFPIDSIGHIFVASDDDLISSKVFSAVETRGDSIKIIGSSRWLELPVIKYDIYSRLGAVLYAPGYKIKSRSNYENFRQRYLKKHKVAPSDYAATGYEMMYFLGHSLNDMGKYFQLGWNKKGYVPGHLSVGYDFQNANDNQAVPFLMFDEDGVNVIYNGHEYRD